VARAPRTRGGEQVKQPQAATARAKAAKLVASTEKDYAAPALEKGLDILELIADQKTGMGQSQIAAALDRSIHEIYRMLSCLERRGYLYRASTDDRYYLSLKLFELAHRHPPTQGLLQIAMPIMRRLADETGQSCNLGIHSAGRVLVVAQVESPAPVGVSVRAGTLFPMLPNAAGRVLLANQGEETQQSWLSAAGADSLSAADRKALLAALRQVTEQGYADVRDVQSLGSITVSYPVIGSYGHAVAALTVPYIALISFPTRPLDDVHARTCAAAAAISQVLSTQR
jgi:DNA-binding IclR family transcriptional regulator